MVSSIPRLPAVAKMTGLSRSSIYLRISSGTFPRPVSLELGRWDGGKARSCLAGAPSAEGFGASGSNGTSKAHELISWIEPRPRRDV
jgi:Prophage CP4-57 regulatory protein (AlpA)